MAQRFVKKPGAQGRSRAMLLFLLPIPLLGAAILSLAKGELVKLVVDAIALALLLYAAILARRGLAEEAEYRRRKIAKPPRIPLKTIAAVLISLLTACVAYFSAGYAWPIAGCFGLGAFFGFFLVYGLDPRREKVAESIDGVTTEEVVRAIDEGQQAIAGIEAANRRIHHPELSQRLDRITRLAHKILQTIEEDPRDLRRARKFLTVYLEGAQRVSEGYARTHGPGQGGELEANFRRVLMTIEQVFGEQYDKLRQNNLLDLDVQIEVLKTQLEQEGIL